METDTWIERTIIQRLSTHDRRYKHDYGGLEADTDELVMACGYLKSLDEDDARPGMMETLQHEEEIEEDVEDAIETLRDMGLLTKAGKNPVYQESFFERLEHPKEAVQSGPDDTVPVWTLTDDGLAEAARINEEYEADLAWLRDEYEDDLEDAPRDELTHLIKTYGVKPDLFQQ
jgi:hypothetical protein